MSITAHRLAPGLDWFPNSATDNGLVRAVELPDMSLPEVKNRATITDAIEIGRHPGVVQVTFRAPLDVAGNCFVYLRQSGDERRLIVLKFADETVHLSLPGEGLGKIVLSTNLDREEQVSLSDRQLRPYKGVIIEFT